MRTLNELKQIARNDDWQKFLSGDDFCEMVEEIAQLRVRDKVRLDEVVCGWQDRLTRLDTMAAEIADTPGAENLVLLANSAASAINQLFDAMDQTLEN